MKCPADNSSVLHSRGAGPQPAVLLLDEPLSSLDPDSRKRLGQEVRDILRDAGQNRALSHTQRTRSRTDGQPHWLFESRHVGMAGTTLEVG